MTLRMLRWATFALLVVLAPFAAWAQGPTPGSAPPTAASDQELLKPAELEALVAPIALYPDTLLAEVLMARRIRSRRCRPIVGRPPTRTSRAIN